MLSLSVRLFAILLLVVAPLTLRLSRAADEPAAPATEAPAAAPDEAAPAEAPAPEQPAAEQPPAEQPPAAPVLSWIWAGTEATEKQVVYARIKFDVAAPVTKAHVAVAADDQVKVFLDGKPLFEHSGWTPAFGTDVTEAFKLAPEQGRGGHLLACEVTNSAGPGALLLDLKLETADGVQHVLSGADWKTSSAAAEPNWNSPEFDDAAWVAATVIAPVGQGPWTSVTAESVELALKLKEPDATAPESLNHLKNFHVELLYSVPSRTEGSWVNLCSEPKGRLYASDQYGDLYRLTPPPIGSTDVPLQVEHVPVPLGEAQGLLWAFDSLYVVVNGGGKYQSGLYQVRDTNNDDQLDDVKLLKSIDGAGEHGPHAVVLSPTGKSLYIVCGNSTKLVDVQKTKVPRHWSEDHLLPRMPDGRGFMRDVLAPGGCIYRVSPDGTDWTLISMGFRNEFDAGFNKFGDLFAYDADMEWDVNTPWYRPTRVCQVVSGSDWGWRNGAGKYPPHYVDTLPAAANIGLGSPTGVCFGYGAKFPAKYQDAHFICDWSYGKLYAVHLTPDGAGYGSEIEEFVSGAPLPLTDVIINPHDRAMYFSIGGRRVKSGLYRVTYTGDEPTDPVATTAKPTKAMVERRNLEKFHGAPNPAAVDAVWPYLSNPDRFLRYAARVALEFQDPATWQDRALAEKDPQATITAMLALVRSLRLDKFHRAPDSPAMETILKAQILRRLMEVDWDQLSIDGRLELVRTMQVALTRLDEPAPYEREKLVEHFDARFPTESSTLNIDLANLLVYLGSPTVAEKTVALLEKAPTQEEQIDLARALRVLKTGWTPELRTRYFTWFLKAARYQGGNSFELFIKNIREDALATVSEEERPTYIALLESAPKETTDAVQVTRPFVKQWTLDELAPIVADGLKQGRNFDRGRELFAGTSCFGCHRFSNEGGAVGPDLTGVSGRFSPRDLLESIIDPSKAVSDQYEAVVIQTVEGQVVTGRIVNLSGDQIMVMPNMLEPNNIVSVDRRHVEEMMPSKVSMMPTGLLNTCQPDEVLDLLAYMLSRGNRQHAMFRP